MRNLMSIIYYERELEGEIALRSVLYCTRLSERRHESPFGLRESTIGGNGRWGTPPDIHGMLFERQSYDRRGG